MTTIENKPDASKPEQARDVAALDDSAAAAVKSGYRQSPAATNAAQ